MQLYELSWLTRQDAITGPDLRLDIGLCRRLGLLARLEDVREALLGHLEIPAETGQKGVEGAFNLLAPPAAAWPCGQFVVTPPPARIGQLMHISAPTFLACHELQVVERAAFLPV